MTEHDNAHGPERHIAHGTERDIEHGTGLDARQPPVPTGAVLDGRIAQALRRLDDLSSRPPAEHVEIYDEVHAVLQDALADAQTEQRQAVAGDATP